MECMICFEVRQCFKVLQCSHLLCPKCAEDLAAGKVTTASQASNSSTSKPKENGVASLSSSKTELHPSPAAARPSPPAEESSNDARSIECPKCRKVTPLDTDGNISKLPSKFTGDLHCTQCDERKCVDEFRWCHTCSMSVCSRCYIDKHQTLSPDDGKVLGLHRATRWDSPDYPAVRFCLEQLRLDSARAHENAQKVTEYVKSYLEGLQEHICAEIEQKTKQLCENDYREKMRTLSEAYGVDLRNIDEASVRQKSYESVIPTLYELSGRKVRPINVQKQKYKINSVPYKDMSRQLLGVENVVIGTYFDRELISNKLVGESLIVGANVIKKPSDTCLLRRSAEDKTPAAILITDFESGLFVFKIANLQLTGPIQLKQSYHKYSKIAVVGDHTSAGAAAGGTGLADPTFAAARRQPTTVMVTVQAQPNQWSYILVEVQNDGGKIEQKSIDKANHFSIPGHEKLRIASSRRTLLGLGTNHLYRFVRGASTKEAWKGLYSVACPQDSPPSKSPQQQQQNQEKEKAYYRIGPITDFTDHTEVLITNGQWQSMDVLRFGWPDDRLWSVQRVELANLMSVGVSLGDSSPMKEPVLFPHNDTEEADRVILIDRKQPNVYVFERSSKRGYQLARFGTKVPHKIVFTDVNRAMMIVKHKENPNIRSLEFYA